MANVNTINWYVITESVQRTIALEQGTIDMCGSISADDLVNFEGKDGYQVGGSPDLLSMTLFPNCDDSSLGNDLNLRLAIFYAISSQAILDGVYGGKGTVLFEHTPDWVVDYNKAWETEDNYYHYNPEKAKEYLEASKYDGRTLKLICGADAKSTNTAQLVQNFLLQIGINTEVLSYEGTVFNEYVQDPGQWDIMLKNTNAAAGYFVQASHSTFSAIRYLWGGSENFIFDDKLQELIVTAYSVDTFTPESVEALHRQFIDNAYVMGLVNFDSYFVVPDWVTGVTLSSRHSIMPGGCVYEEAE
jgi:ABC-type transport system substrate-binding protein